ncbi:MAG: cache domain-containing protein [Anaerolineales bacterium]|nr:cache domain-containing protein [Anaerolineales bacterium]
MSKSFPKFNLFGPNGMRVPISTNLILNHMLIIVLISTIFIAVGISLIGDRIIAEEHDNVHHDLNTAREIYTGELRHINDVVHLTADRLSFIDALVSDDIDQIAAELEQVTKDEGLDILVITDIAGQILFCCVKPDLRGDDLSNDSLIEVVSIRKEPYAATSIMSAEILQRRADDLADQAHLTLIDTPLARETTETELIDGMMLKAAAPVFDYEDELIGVLLGGVLLTRNYEIVDTIKGTVHADLTYKGKDIGTAAIIQDDVRISTNVLNEDGSRAIGTRVSEEIYNRVVIDGEPWIGRDYVVNDWYIAAYEPIRDIYNKVIGILYVGVLEQKYVDIQRQAILAFLAITLLGTLASMMLSYLLSKRISVPIEKLAIASRAIAGGNLEAKVDVVSNDELGDLAKTFNAMASSLQQRDEQLKEFTQNKIMESERLALIGQLAANVAHELNNPLQGIVTYSHLLLENMPNNGSEKASSSIQRIVTQANRCRDIIRGLLDFSRQRKPDTTVCNINAVIQECVTFVENQASFQNIEFVEHFEEDLPMIIVDPSQMQQVFLNMIINATEAMEEGGDLTLDTRSNSTENSIEISITDTGHGIPEEHFDKLFDPFFTTKEVGHGTGLGLAISYGIVKEHQGTINVESTLGRGTTFIIRLPIRSEETEVDEGN